jgi:hypothetical protein
MSVGSPGNRLLAMLSSKDRELLEPDLEVIDLPLRRSLAQRNRRIEHVYFIDSGIASIVADSGQPIEVGVIGKEGMSSVGVLLGSDRSDQDIYMQVAGAGRRIRAEILANVKCSKDAQHRKTARQKKIGIAVSECIDEDDGKPGQAEGKREHEGNSYRSPHGILCEQIGNAGRRII